MTEGFVSAPGNNRQDAQEPSRPLRVLGLHGWIRWKLLKRGPSWSTFVLDFHGELEDFGEV